MATNTQTDCGVTVLSNAMTTVYTVPADTTFTVGMLQLCETSAGNRSVRLCVVPSGGSPTASNAVLWDFTIGANDALRLLQGDVWAEGTSLRGLADTAGAVTVRLSGIQTA